MELNNQAVIVSGGGSGLGAATAEHLAQQGARVAILDRNIAEAEKVASRIDGIAIECDVTSSESVEKAIAYAKAQYGVARVCVNCAGVAPAQRVIGRDAVMQLDTFASVININLIGSFNVLRCVVANMSTAEPLNSDNERGVVINTASVAAFDGQIGQAAYSASKGGIVSMTLPLAREFASFGIRVMTIAPGIMGTPMLLGMPQNVQDSLSATVTFPKRLGAPTEFAQLVEHIVENSYLNGEVIRLDGAIRMAAK